MKILIGSKNPSKIEGAKQAFCEYFEEVEIIGYPVSSNVSDEPVDKDIYKGAKNRVDNLIKYAKEHDIVADYYLGIESGITNLLGKWMITNVAVIKDKSGYESWGTSPSFPVPQKYVNEIIEKELGSVMDRLFNKEDLRSNVGGINYLTKGKLDRFFLTKQAFIMALTQFINKDVWKD